MIIHKINKDSAFTLVELIVAIVIIGILAAISIVAYSGISLKANEATLQSDLTNASKKLKLYQALHGNFPTSLPADETNNYCPTGPSDTFYCIKPSSTNVLIYNSSPPYDDFSLSAVKNNVAYNITKDTSPRKVFSGTFAKAWGGAVEEFGVSMINASNDGYITTGITKSFGAGNEDVLISNYNESGNLIWNKTWGGTGIDWAGDIIAVSDGYIFTGYTDSFGAGYQDVFLVKLSLSGDLMWNKTLGRSGTDCGFGIVSVRNGGVVVSGVTGGSAGQVYLAKFDLSGALVWNKTWGGSGYDESNSVIETSDGGYLVVGRTESYGAGLSDGLILKYDANGNFLWNKVYGGIGEDAFWQVIQTSDGGYATVGYTNSFGVEDYDVLLSKLDVNGNLTWTKTLGGSSTDLSSVLMQANDNGFVISGGTQSFGSSANMMLVKFDINGVLSWSRLWGETSGSERGNGVIQAKDGGYVVSGYTDGYGVGLADVILVKFNSNGTINNCSVSICQSFSPAVTSPTMTLTTPSASRSTPSATVATPSATMTTPSLTFTNILAP